MMEGGRSIRLTGSDNCQLEGYIHQASQSTQPGREKLGIVIFHPYPRLGGCCDDPVVLSVFRLAMRTPAVHTVVRYNQRGVGSSAGSTSIWGDADMADAIAVCQHILGLPDGPDYLHVVGYSWGACLAAHAAQLATVRAYAGISPVTGKLASIFLRTQRHLSKLVPQSELPKLFVIGDRDQFSSTSSLKQTVKHMEKQQAVDQQLVSLTIMPGCDHFFVHQRRELAVCVVQFSLAQQLHQQKHA